MNQNTHHTSSFCPRNLGQAQHYLAALDRYDRTEIQRAVDVLRDQSTGDAATRIRRFLGDAREAVARRNDRRGCFLCNAAVDQAPMDGEIQEKVLAMMKRMESAIAAALSEDVQTAQWPSKRRAPTALTLINAYLGLRVLARSGSSARELAAVILMTMEGCGLRVNNNEKST